MADWIKAEIEFGGEINKAQTEKIFQFSQEWSLSLEWDGGVISKDEFEEALKDEELKLYGTGRNGEYPEIEKWAKEEKIPFIRISEEGAECDREMVRFNGSETQETVVDLDNTPMHGQYVLEKIYFHLVSGDTIAAKRYIEEKLFDESILPLKYIG